MALRLGSFGCSHLIKLMDPISFMLFMLGFVAIWYGISFNPSIEMNTCTRSLTYIYLPLQNLLVSLVNSSLPSNNSFISVLLYLALSFQSTAENGSPALDYFTYSSSIADYLKSASLVISHAGNSWLTMFLALYI